LAIHIGALLVLPLLLALPLRNVALATTPAICSLPLISDLASLDVRSGLGRELALSLVSSAGLILS
jgi:hypothetical protein